MALLEGRVAVITGAGQGIGAAIMRRLARDGATVAGIDLRRDAVAEVLAECGNGGLALACDVSRRDQVEEAIEHVASEFGRVDILVNNAGLTRDNLIHKMTDEDFDTVVAVHLRGGFLCSQAVQRHMVRRRYGKIVMMSSRSALGNRGQANYSAAKAGLQGLTRTLAIELGPFGINVNAIAPGHIDTAMTRAVAERLGVPYDELQQRTIEQNAIKRVGQPEDVASLAAFLVSDEAGFITGQTVYIAGRP